MIKKRVEQLEKKVIDKDHGLRVEVCLSAYYGEFNPETDIYWTDEPIREGVNLSNVYDQEPYRRVKHPEGKVPVSGNLIGVW